jgi:hypothetical protein
MAGRAGAINSDLSVDAGKAIKRNAGDDGWETFTPAAGGGFSSYTQLQPTEFDAGADGSWEIVDLSGLGTGIAEGDIAEVVIYNSTNSARVVGVRKYDTAVDRWFDLYPDGFYTIHVEIVNVTGNPSVEVYEENHAHTQLYLVGYWSTS